MNYGYPAYGNYNPIQPFAPRSDIQGYQPPVQPIQPPTQPQQGNNQPAFFCRPVASREIYMEGRAGRDDDDGWHLSGMVSVPDQDVKLDEHTAKEWVQQMDNADGTKGPHWSMDQTKQVAAQKGVSCDPLEFWVTMNMMYSDYCVLAKKHNVNTIDFYVDMAKAFLDDKDAKADKLARYYWAVVK